MSLEISSLVDQLDRACKAIPEDQWHQQSPALRRKTCDTLRKLSVDLEDPGDLVDRMIYQNLDNVLLRIALDLGIFSVLIKSNDAVNLQTLAKATGADQTLLRRILRALNAINAVGEVGVDSYVATNFTRAFNTPKGIHGAKLAFEFATPAWNKLPAFLSANKYRNPVDPLNSALQLAYNSPNVHMFGIIQKYPECLKAFNAFMAAQREGRLNFADFFPANKQLGDGFDASEGAVVLVDVGGGQGHEIVGLKKKFPDLPGRTILQDRPDVVKDAQELDGLEVVPHDFFDPQPIQGARAYYFRNIFHDWSDDDCIKILHQTTAAMTPGYSKILINELVIPDQDASAFMTRSDLNMMVHFAAMERSEKQWRELLGQAGLEIINIWTEEAGSESIIESMIK